jgi:hypothetical protein
MREALAATPLPAGVASAPGSPWQEAHITLTSDETQLMQQRPRALVSFQDFLFVKESAVAYRVSQAEWLTRRRFPLYGIFEKSVARLIQEGQRSLSVALTAISWLRTTEFPKMHTIVRELCH